MKVTAHLRVAASFYVALSFPSSVQLHFETLTEKNSCPLRFVFSLLELLLFERLQELLNTDKNWICSERYGKYYGEKSTIFFSESSQAVSTRPSSIGRRNQGLER